MRLSSHSLLWVWEPRLDVVQDLVTEVRLLYFFAVLSQLALVGWGLPHEGVLDWRPDMPVVRFVLANVWWVGLVGMRVLPGVTRSGVEG